MKVTVDEYVHDSKALPDLVEDITKSNSMTTSTVAIVGKLFADDSAYDGNDIFRCLADNAILPCIKLRKNAKVRHNVNHTIRNLAVTCQKNDLQKWKDSLVSYGKRWIVETVFSCIKRRFSECVFL
jgi:hypothetical protein